MFNVECIIFLDLDCEERMSKECETSLLLFEIDKFGVLWKK